MFERFEKASLVIGRSLLGLYFLLPGLAKFINPQMHIELMQRHQVPFAEPLLWIAGVANIVLGLLLLANRHVAYAAYGCVLYILVINIMLHDFWNFDGIEGAHETQNFVKNLGILAGCLILASFSRARADERGS
ncbi:MAG: DoxX family protein [Parvibaculales bacterium]